MHTKIKSLLSHKDFVYIFSGGFWVIGSQILASTTSLIVVMVLTNTLSPELFGQYRFVLSILPIFALFSISGLGPAITQSVANNLPVNLYGLAFKKIKWGLLGSLLSIIISLYYLYRGNEQLSIIFFSIVFLIPLLESFSIYSFFYKGKKNFRTPAIYESLSKIIQTIFILPIIIYTQNITIIIVSFIFIQIITRFFFYKRTISSIYFKYSTTSQQEKSSDEVLKYGKKLTLIGSLGILSSSIDKILVWKFLGAEALAIYTLLLLVPLEVVKGFSFLPQLALPKFVLFNWSLKITKYTLYRYMGILFIGLCILAFVYSLLSTYILGTFLFPNYKEYMYLSVLASPILILMPLRMVFGTVLLSIKKSSNLLLFQSVDFISYILMFAILLFTDNLTMLTVIIIFSIKILLTVIAQIISIRLIK